MATQQKNTRSRKHSPYKAACSRILVSAGGSPDPSLIPRDILFPAGRRCHMVAILLLVCLFRWAAAIEGRRNRIAQGQHVESSSDSNPESDYALRKVIYELLTSTE